MINYFEYSTFETVDEFIAAFRWNQALLNEASRLLTLWVLKDNDAQVAKYHGALEFLESQLHWMAAHNHKFKDDVEIDWKHLDTVFIKKKG